MKKSDRKGMKYIYIGSIIGTLSLIIGIFLSVIFTSEKQITKDIFSFIGGAVAGIFGFVSAFLITEQNKYIKEKSDERDVLEQIKYVILNINRDFELIDECIKEGITCRGFRKDVPYKRTLEEISKYKISTNLIGGITLNDYIYDKSWGEKLSSIKDFNDKRKLIDFMRKTNLYTKGDTLVEVVRLYKDIIEVIEVLIKYNVYDECFENFGLVDNVWRKDKMFFNSIKNRVKALYYRFNLSALECRELSVRIDNELIRFAKEQLDKRESELNKRESELNKNIENN